MAEAQREAVEASGFKPRSGKQNAQIGLKGFTQVIYKRRSLVVMKRLPSHHPVCPICVPRQVLMQAVCEV